MIQQPLHFDITEICEVWMPAFAGMTAVLRHQLFVPDLGHMMRLMVRLRQLRHLLIVGDQIITEHTRFLARGLDREPP